MLFIARFWKAFAPISITVFGWLIYTVLVYWKGGESKHIIIALIVLLAAFVFTCIRISILNKNKSKE